MSFLDKHYESVLGLSTRSNPLTQNPNSARRGSKNFRFNYQDELTNANGFQHKSDSEISPSVGYLEYKFRDINSGEGKNEILSVGQDGNLYRKKAHYLKVTALNSKTDYSLYYDGVTWSFVVNPGAITYTFNATATMSDVAAGIASATGMTIVVVDDAGATVTSTKLAYLMDVIIGRELVANEVIKEASSWYWELVENPDAGTSVEPFPITRDFYNDDNYEGISYININNVCYITDGGFPMKYDGYQVYRMGMPETLQNQGLTFNSFNTDVNFSGQTVTGTTVVRGPLTALGTYKYILQFGFVDSNGAETIGGYEGGESLGYIVETLTGGENAITILTNASAISENFPIWSALVSGNQSLTTTGGTINVSSGHNIKVGMLLRIPIKNGIGGELGAVGFSYVMAYVSAVTSTTITVDFGPNTSTKPTYIYPFQKTPYSSTATFTSGSAVVTNITNTANITVGDYLAFDTLAGPAIGRQVQSIDSATQITMNGNATASGVDIAHFVTADTLMVNAQVLQGGYASDFYKNKITDVVADALTDPRIHFGAFVRIWRTENGLDIFYKVHDAPLRNNGSISITDYIEDTQLGVALLDSPTGADLPRACKYLATWQNQILQAGRPVDPTVASDFYPGSIGTATNIWGSLSTTYTGYLYGENSLCDFQSYYWNDVQNPEGFPQSGLYENLVPSPNNDRIKGMAPNKDAFFVFTETATALVTGALAVGELNQEIFEEEVGLANHRTLFSVEGSLVWLDSTKGFYSCVAGRLPINIGYDIQDEFKTNPDGLDPRKSFAANFDAQDLYFCVVDTKLFVLDYAKLGITKSRLAWYQWDKLNAKTLLYSATGVLLLGDGTKAWKLKVTETKYDKSNHTTAIDFDYRSAWLTYGLPTIDKHFERVWVSSVQGDFTLTVNQYANYNNTSIGELAISFEAQSSSKLAVKNYMKACLPKLSGFSIGFQNSTVNANVLIQGFEVELDREYDATEPKL